MRRTGDGIGAIYCLSPWYIHSAWNEYTFILLPWKYLALRWEMGPPEGWLTQPVHFWNPGRLWCLLTFTSKCLTFFRKSQFSSQCQMLPWAQYKNVLILIWVKISGREAVDSSNFISCSLHLKFDYMILACTNGEAEAGSLASKASNPFNSRSVSSCPPLKRAVRDQLPFSVFFFYSLPSYCSLFCKQFFFGKEAR